ncbi:HPr kinase/phosphorylase [Novispirillum sp. DQ9]|uniref:HPr kinase/phosphorylase n=1 Tax=Novispirillum sp. DQ9 TaxID=3398612 RepID=UPI003C7E5066
MITSHATCVAIAGYGVLLRAPSGGGKSDLALRLIDSGAVLVGDDYCTLTADDGRLIASAGPGLAGLLEVRGLGIVRLPHLPRAEVRLAVDLRPGGPIERMPEPARTDVAGVSLPLVALDPFEASAPAKVRLAMRLATGDISGAG